MSSVTQRWVHHQDPALIAAIHHAFCGHHQPCDCLTPKDKEVLSAWVTRAVMRGFHTVIRYRQDGREGLRHGYNTGRVRIVDDEARTVTTIGDVPSEPAINAPLRCDWPGCEFRTPPELRQPKSSLGIHKSKAHGVRGATVKPSTQVDTPKDTMGALSREPAAQSIPATSTQVDRETPAGRRDRLLELLMHPQVHSHELDGLPYQVDRDCAGCEALLIAGSLFTERLFALAKRGLAG